MGDCPFLARDLGDRRPEETPPTKHSQSGQRGRGTEQGRVGKRQPSPADMLRQDTIYIIITYVYFYGMAESCG